jgi:hypothetical protein
VIYSIVVIPIINLLFVALIWVIVGATAMVALSPLFATIYYCSCCQIGDVTLCIMARYYMALMIFLLPALMVALNEKMVVINTVGTDDRLWTFGQTFALLVALSPIWDAIQLLRKSFTLIRKIQQVSLYN